MSETTTPRPGRWALIRYRARFAGYLLRALSLLMVLTNLVLGIIGLVLHHWISVAVSLASAAFCLMVGICNPLMRHTYWAAERQIRLYYDLTALVRDKVPTSGTTVAFGGGPGSPIWVVTRRPNWATFALLTRVEEADFLAMDDLDSGRTDEAVIVTRSLAVQAGMPVVSSGIGGQTLRRNAVNQIIDTSPPRPSAWRALLNNFRALGHNTYYVEDYEIREAMDGLRSAVHARPIPSPTEDPE